MNKFTNGQLFMLIKAHLLEIVREPAVLFWGIIFPILMAWGLGIAFTKKTDINRKVAIVKSATISSTNDTSKLARFLAENAQIKDTSIVLTLNNNTLGNLKVSFVKVNWANAYQQLKKGTVSIILEDSANEIHYHFDPANAEALSLYQQLSEVFQYGVNAYIEKETTIKPLTITGTRYIDFFIPGLMAMGIMMSCTWGISYTLIDRRSKKLLRRMVATPMKKQNLLIALITARFTMNFVEGLILLVFAILFFHIRIQGSLLALVLILLAGNVAFSGFAVLLSSRTANPEIGNGLINAFVTPMMVISGVFFSYHNFPDWSIPVIQYMPLTLLVDAVRSVFNESISVIAIAKEIVILSSIGILSFIVGLKMFRWY